MNKIKIDNDFLKRLLNLKTIINKKLENNEKEIKNIKNYIENEIDSDNYNNLKSNLDIIKFKKKELNKYLNFIDNIYQSCRYDLTVPNNDIFIQLYDIEDKIIKLEKKRHYFIYSLHFSLKYINCKLNNLKNIFKNINYKKLKIRKIPLKQKYNKYKCYIYNIFKKFKYNILLFVNIILLIFSFKFLIYVLYHYENEPVYLFFVILLICMTLSITTAAIAQKIFKIHNGKIWTI